MTSHKNVLGLASGAVVIVPYDPRWRDEFTRAARELEEALGSSIIAVHHVGSTAIPGLCAKPILDVLVSVPDFRAALDLVPAIEAIGYEFRPNEEIPDRHYFRRRRGTVGTHHLSLAEPGSHYQRVTIGFRDALRADPIKAAEYAELKTGLARKFPFDRGKYIEGKSAFVAKVLADLEREILS
jgi:GrpB-like predicted nucleotidyltransferase (UPF0157 family)